MADAHEVASEEGAPVAANRPRWVEVAVAREVEGNGPFLATADGTDLVVLRTGGVLRAFEGRCPHQGALLAEGELDAGQLVCRGHGWKFDACTGKHEGGDQHLRACPLEQRGGKLMADISLLAEHPSSHPVRERRIQELPGPKGLPVLGNLMNMELSRLHLTLEGWAKTHGDIYTFRVGGRRAVVVSEPRLVEQVLRARPDLYRRIATADPVFRELGMPGVFSAEGEAWRIQRRLVVEALSQRNFGGFFPALRVTLERLVRRWRGFARAGSAVDVVAELKRFTTDSTTHLAFGHDVNSLERDDDRLQQNLNLILPAINRRLNSPVAYWRLLKLPSDRRVDRAVKEVRAILQALLADARARLASHPEQATDPRNLLEAMLVTRDESGQPFSDEDMLGNALQVLVAGQETSAAAVAWAVHELCDQPDIVGSLRQEIDALLGDDTTPRDLAVCNRLGQAESIVRESLRVRAVAPLLFVENNVDTLLGGVALPRGTWLMLLTRLAGIQPQHVNESDLFRPARWQNEKSPSHQRPAPDLPFGSGPRICPGRSFANLEMRALLSVIYKNFDLTRTNRREDVRERFGFTMEPHGLAVRLQNRVAAPSR